MSPDSNNANFKNFSFLMRHKSDNEICPNDFLIYFEIQETLNHRIYIVNDDTCISCLGLDLYANRQYTKINLQMMKQVVKETWWDYILFKKDFFLVWGWYLLLLSDRIIFLLLLLHSDKRKVNKSGVKTK